LPEKSFELIEESKTWLLEFWKCLRYCFRKLFWQSSITV